MPNRPITATRKLKPLEQLDRAEGHAQLAGDRIQPDRRQREAQHHGADDLGRRLLAHADEAAEGQELDGEELGRPELQREAGEVAGQEGDHQHGEQGAHERGGERPRQRLAGPALLRHRVAVEGGGHRPGLARDVEQDRGDRPAEQRAPVDAGQHDDRRGRRHAEGQRQQDRHAVGPAQARQHADQDAQERCRPACRRCSWGRPGRRSPCISEPNASTGASSGGNGGLMPAQKPSAASSGPLGSGTRNQSSNITKSDHARSPTPRPRHRGVAVPAEAHA